MQAMGETQGAVNDYVRVGDSIHSLDGKLRICHTFPTICSLARILTFLPRRCRMQLYYCEIRLMYGQMHMRTVRTVMGQDKGRRGERMRVQCDLSCGENIESSCGCRVSNVCHVPTVRYFCWCLMTGHGTNHAGASCYLQSQFFPGILGLVQERRRERNASLRKGAYRPNV